MRSRICECAVLASALTLASSTMGAPLNLRVIVEGLERPVALANARDGSGRLFIVQQTGAIRVFDGHQLLPAPFLDLSALVSAGNEQGLLGLAFHPDYETNGYFYIDYTDRTGDTRVARYRRSNDDPNLADAASGVVLLSIAQPFANHNGGQLAFGPDGNLWIAVGDGGSAGDPMNNAQNGATLLGKILRLDVDGGFPYAIPEDNPFRSDPGVLDEIWALGLRNPWRFSFDRLTGDLFIADVGQGSWEEVDFEPVTSPGGRNYGWRRMEGAHCYNPSSGCNDGSLVLPILEYSHSEGCSITGGFRYRGTEMPELMGTYIFGDFCSGRIWGGKLDPDSGSWTRMELLASSLSISSFGEDDNGELYVADLSGAVYRLYGETFCNIQLERSDYQTGDAVRATVLEVANLSSTTVAVEFKLWLEVPGRAPVPLSRGGADGSVVLPANFAVDSGPATLFTLAGSAPPGRYALGCRFLDPVTGAPLSEDSSVFEVR